ncbi:MAG: CTP synthetase [Alphaproteobacteria bacterium]|nr:CTP synthetase [Alphaproteobacteria bacterium]HCQ71306.1 CTP synthetase [Rhodospirillaceae bacterium]
MTRFIFMTGGVVSSLGKGLASAALAALLQARGYSVRLCKMDPYLNVDPGTMSPFQHGEVFVTDDGAETDLDLGHYERFTGVPARQSDNVTTGRIYTDVLARERKGEYLGATIQVVPHITNEIQDFIRAKDGSADFVLVEIGGTVGDIESLPFLEAIRQFGNEVGRERALFAHMTLIPYIPAAGELKTKPTQHSVKELMSYGIRPRVLLCRADREISEEERNKIALFCNIDNSSVIPALDVKSIYEVPLTYHAAGLDNEVMKHFNLPVEPGPDLSTWEEIVHRVKEPEHKVKVAIVGKYISLTDSYKSLNEALIHGGIANNAKVELKFIEAEAFEKDDEDLAAHLRDCHAILVPGAFGSRGAEGKIKAVQYAREHKIPYFGICFGMQMAVIEAARHQCGITGANSTEFGPCEVPLIGLMTEWIADDGSVHQRTEETDLGGTMRLGAYPAKLVEGSRVAEIYGATDIEDRHRHRYEVNIAYKEQLEEAGLIFSGLSPDGKLPEIVERQDHPWFVGVQFHPELKSKPFDPHPLFISFIEAAVKQSGLV